LLVQLKESEYHRTAALLAPLETNLSLLSLLDGKTNGRIFTDHPDFPSAVLVELGHHLFLAGVPGSTGFIQNAHESLHQIILPQAQAAGNDLFMLHMAQETWDGPAQTILEGLYPILRTRQYFECCSLDRDWREILPSGFELRPVDADLVVQDYLKHMDTLHEELCSERSSVADFLDKSFGFAALHGEDLAAWCLSEYNMPGRCEVGVATMEEYQKRGLGTVVSLALVEHALSQGIQRIGWHCWKWNTASSALAARAGFAHICDYPVYMCILNQGVQFALHGFDLRSAGVYPEALEWYQKSLATGSAPAWAYYETARCLARLDQPEAAIEALRQAAEHGFDHWAAARGEPDLKTLRKHPAWDTIVLPG
jgi:GNAT superfamily N-acetyltransferase